MKPEISVIIPVYKVEKYLRRCLDSVLAQTMEQFEVVLVDDGSPDSCGAICDEYAQKDRRVRTFHKENGGLSDARNYGLLRAKGAYITFVDSDDFVAADYLECLYHLMKLRQGVQMSIVGGQFLAEGTEPQKSTATVSEVLPMEAIIRKMLAQQAFTHTAWGKLYARELWADIRFPKGQLYEDYATTYRVAAQTSCAAWCDAEKYYYMQHGDSIMHQRCSEKTLSVLPVAKEETLFISRQWPKLSEEAAALQIRVYLKTLQAILNDGIDSYPDCQKEILSTVKENAVSLLKNRNVILKDKVKLLSLLPGKRFFLWFYNLNDGNRQYFQSVGEQ